MSTQICPSYFKAMFREWFSIMLKPFGVSFCKSFKHSTLGVSIIAVIFSNAVLFSALSMMVNLACFH